MSGLEGPGPNEQSPAPVEFIVNAWLPGCGASGIFDIRLRSRFFPGL
jgi:hypothetical protein